MTTTYRVAAPGIRPAGPDDGELLYQVYRSTRAAEFAPLGWPEEQLDPFLRSQLRARDAAYAAYVPPVEDWVVLAGDEPAGRLVVQHTDAAVHLVDLDLLADQRGRGIGSTLLTALAAEAHATGRPLRLAVVPDNPARRLYERLGFVVTGIIGAHLTMEWT